MKKFLAVILIVGLLVVFYFLFIKEDKNDKYELGINVSTKDNINFELDLSHHKVGDIEEYKFSDSLKLKLEFIGIEDFDSLNYYRYKLSINDKYVMEDGTTGDTRLISILNKAIIFKEDQNTDDRSTKIFVYSYSGEKIDEIHELEDEKGMIPYKFEINNGKLVVTGSRINHKYSVELDGNSYIICSNQVKKLDSDLGVITEYKYDVNSDRVKLEDTKIIDTLEKYLSKEKCM